MGKKKKGNRMLVLLAVLAVMIVILFILKYYNKAQEEKKTSQEEAEVIHIYEADELQSIAYSDVSDTMEFEKVDGIWQYSEDSEIPLIESTMQTMESSFCDITAVKEIEEPDDLADYGLEEPTCELTLTNQDGETTKFLVGLASGENYYFMENGGEKVYTVAPELTSEMIWDMGSLVQTEQFVSVTDSNFVKEVVTNPDKTETTFDAADESQEDEVTAITSGLSGFYFTDCVDYHVTDSTLSQYGLDEANRTVVELTYTETNSDGDAEEKTQIFYVGDKDSTGTYYYVQMEGSLMVNEVVIDSVETILGLS